MVFWYAGKKNKADNARFMCARIIDLDGVDSIEIINLILGKVTKQVSFLDEKSLFKEIYLRIIELK